MLHLNAGGAKTFARSRPCTQIDADVAFLADVPYEQAGERTTNVVEAVSAILIIGSLQRRARDLKENERSRYFPSLTQPQTTGTHERRDSPVSLR
jgi:hypothetical protein